MTGGPCFLRISNLAPNTADKIPTASMTKIYPYYSLLVLTYLPFLDFTALQILSRPSFRVAWGQARFRRIKQSEFWTNIFPPDSIISIYKTIDKQAQLSFLIFFINDIINPYQRWMIMITEIKSIGTGAMSDPYMPIEKDYKLTRQGWKLSVYWMRLVWKPVFSWCCEEGIKLGMHSYAMELGNAQLSILGD